MPAARCSSFHNDGTPWRDGCRNSVTCRYVHPDDERWESLPLIKTNVRCMHFDNEGYPIRSGCRTNSKECRFVHPDDPRWERAEPTRARERMPRVPPYISVSAPSGPRALRTISDRNSGVASGPRTGDAARPALSRIQTDSSTDVRASRSARPSVSFKSESPLVPTQPADRTISVLTTDSLTASKRNSPAASPSSSRIPLWDPLLSPVFPDSTNSQSVDTDKRLAWKRRLSLLAQALTLCQELRDKDAELDKRKALQSIVSVLAPSARVNSDDSLKSSEERRKIIEEQLIPVANQLLELDVWPLLSIPDESTTQFGTGERFDGYAALLQRLDETEAHFAKHTGLSNPARRSTATATSLVRDTSDDIKMDNPPPRPLKRRRTSLNGTFMRSSKLAGLMERLDIVERKVLELEKETLHGERVAETIDDLLQEKLLASGILKRDAESGQSYSSDDETPPTSDPLESVVRELNGDFDAYCIELAENVASAGKLELEVGQLRAETNTLKERQTHLHANQGPLQERQDELDRQVRDITEQLVELRYIPNSGDTLANERDKLVREVTRSVQGSVDARLGELKSIGASQHKDMQRSVLKSLEPTLLMTETIYDAMARHFEEGQRGAGGPVEKSEPIL